MKFLLILLSVIEFIAAYDFEDHVYNQLLWTEYGDYSPGETLLHHRARRDKDVAKCPHKNKLCCGDDLLCKLHDKYRDIKQECFKEVTGGPPLTGQELLKRKAEVTCIAQCIGKRKGVLDDDGNIIEEEVMKSAKENMSVLEWFQPHLEDAVKKCLAQAKETGEKRDYAACNPADTTFGYCMLREIQFGCPTDQIKNQTKCDAVRAILKKYESFPLRNK